MAKRDFKAQLTRPEPSSFDQEMYSLHSKNEKNDIHEIKEDNEIDDYQFIPFSTRITRGTFIKLKQTEYWERVTITEIVEAALLSYLESVETSTKALPDKEMKRLAVRKLQTPKNSKKAK